MKINCSHLNVCEHLSENGYCMNNCFYYKRETENVYEKPAEHVYGLIFPYDMKFMNTSPTLTERERYTSLRLYFRNGEYI